MDNLPPDQQTFNTPNALSDVAPSLGPSSENMDGKTSVGLKPNIAAVLSYALVWTIGCVSNWIISLLVINAFEPGGFFALSSIPYASPEYDRVMTRVLFYGVISLIISGVITFGAGFIFFIVEKESRFVRLHTMQAILFSVLSFAAAILISFVAMVLGAIISTVLSIPVSLTFLVIWILLMVKAYNGKMLNLPVIGSLAENIVTK